MGDNPRLGEYHYLNETNRYSMDSIYLNAQGFKYYKEHPKQEVAYNIDRKATSVHEQDHGRADFFYNGDMQRVHAYYGNEEEGLEDRTYSKHYSSLFPTEVTVNQSTGETTSVFYLGGDAYTAPVALINGEDHYLHRDHLGSILAISDSSGSVIEERQFTAWGEVEEFKQNGIIQEKFTDSILPRGFTGHEHFTEVALIHMNGRMYDPQLKRFLSPDNNIQDPFDTRSYDRYGYVWHNPLMNTDPSGEIIQFIIIGAVFGAFNAAVKGGNFGDILLGAVIGGIAGGLGAGVGNLAAGGTFFGATVVSAAGFGGGFVAGFAGGFVGGFVGATLTGLAAGQNIGKALTGGFRAGLISGVLAGLAAGIGAGVNAKKAGGDFWSGRNTPQVNSVNEITTKGITPFESQKPQTGNTTAGLKSSLHEAPLSSTIYLDEIVVSVRPGFNINNALNTLNLNALPLPGIGKCGVTI
ncbi:hypothetical protein OAC88_01830 [Flavobacteriaceae bacterium]|nr:hypothetical protein [Flavobacteriaceae bacterium]